MALTHQFLGEPGNHPLSAAVKLGRNGLGQWSNLRNPHQNISSDSAVR
jgi:hypothetical protein